MGRMRPSFQRLRLGAVLLATALLLLLLLNGDWVAYVALALGLAGAVCVLTAVGRPRDGERPPFLD
jgi:O-antigen/teichoic acid export membrane protein